jgi:hypothetical protein
MTHADATGFELAGVAFLRRPLGDRVHDLETLRRTLAAAPVEVLFNHTQLPRMDAHEDDAPADEISAWVHGVVQDAETAERLAFAVQSSLPDLEALRAALLSVLDRLTAAERRLRQAPPAGEFVPVIAEAVHVPTGLRVREPGELLAALARADHSAWFHHLVEEAWMPAGLPGLFAWLDGQGAGALREDLARESGSGRGIAIIRGRILRRERRRAIRRGVVELSGRPPDERGALAHEAVTRIARRLVRGGHSA